MKWLIISYCPLGEKIKNFVKAKYGFLPEMLLLPRWFFDEEEDQFKSINQCDLIYNCILEKLEKIQGNILNLKVLFTIQIEPPEIDSLLNNWDATLLYEKERQRVHARSVIISRLMLTFPEVHWFFWDERTNRNAIFPDKMWLISFPEIDILKLDCYLGNLFDGFNIRNEIKKIINKKVSYLPIRHSYAVALDEEPAYAYLNAYIAYRLGYSSWSLYLWKSAKKILSVSSSEEKSPTIVFEDLYLNFPDHSGKFLDSDLDEPANDILEKFQRLSYIEFRDRIFGKLENTFKRIFVTIGHHKTGIHNVIWGKNKEYFCFLREKSNIKIKILYKPSGGIFDILRKAGLWNNRKNRPALAGEKNEDGIQFVWPPDEKILAQDEIGHSAPGRLLSISQNLINRAERILKNAMTITDAIHAAVLALEAKELLGNRTPTTSLEALALQHEAEITAESMFYGIEYNLNVKDRFKDIEREVKAISRWFNPKHRKRSELNARLAIIEKLAKRFNELRQFEEEQECLAESRKIRFEFWMRQKPWRWLAWPFLKYLENALVSLPRFFALVLGWLVLFGLLYYFLAPLIIGQSNNINFWNAISSSTVFFFALQSPDNWKVLENYQTFWNFILAFQGFISFFNLTLLLTNIYLIVSRR